MPIQAVLFDLDDTLTDRTATIRDFAARFHEVFPDTLHPIAVDPLEVLLRDADQLGYRPRIEAARQLVRTLPWISPPTPERIVEEWDRQFTERIKGNPAAHPLIASLRGRGMKIGIITNGTGWKQRKKIVTLGLTDSIDALVISEEVEVSKPDPRIFQIALDRLGVPAQNSAFVGDNPEFDALGAHHAGLRAIWFANNLAWPDSKPKIERIITNLDELPAWLD